MLSAPEIQQKKHGSFLSDMYSLGMVICAIFNYGRPLIQANHNTSEYAKQMENASIFSIIFLLKYQQYQFNNYTS